MMNISFEEGEQWRSEAKHFKENVCMAPALWQERFIRLLDAVIVIPLLLRLLDNERKQTTLGQTVINAVGECPGRSSFINDCQCPTMQECPPAHQCWEKLAIKTARIKEVI